MYSKYFQDDYKLGTYNNVEHQKDHKLSLILHSKTLYYQKIPLRRCKMSYTLTTLLKILFIYESFLNLPASL